MIHKVKRKGLLNITNVMAAKILCLWLVVVMVGCEKKVEAPGSEDNTLETIRVEETKQPNDAEKAHESGFVEQSRDLIFDMDEFSIFEEYHEAHWYTISSWETNAEKIGYKPNPNVKAYPRLESDKPVYGSLMIENKQFEDDQPNEYCFVIDESDGAGKGYDRFYFDFNRDYDLTNDIFKQPMKKAPAVFQRNRVIHSYNEVFFDFIELTFEQGPGMQPVSMNFMPLLHTKSENVDSINVSFVAQNGRKGKITLDSKIYEVIMLQNLSLTDRYDRRFTSLSLGKDFPPFKLGIIYGVNGMFYTFSTTPQGDKLIVSPYNGELGFFGIGDGAEKFDEVTFNVGTIASQYAIIDFSQCPIEQGKIKLPVGDYKLGSLRITYDNLRARLQRHSYIISDEEAYKKAADQMKIRSDKPYIFELSHKVTVILEEPNENEHYKLGDNLRVKGYFYEPVMGIIIQTLDDISQREDMFKLPYGEEYIIYKSVDPTVKILNSSGECVAEGEMPFGFNGVCEYSWRIPKNLQIQGNKETYTVEVRLDTKEIYGVVTYRRDIVIEK